MILEASIAHRVVGPITEVLRLDREDVPEQGCLPPDGCQAVLPYPPLHLRGGTRHPYCFLQLGFISYYPLPFYQSLSSQ